MSDTAPLGASRADFDSLVPWARRLFAEGKSTGSVMRAIYGTELPPELYLFDRAYPHQLPLPALPMFHPWQLLALADPAATVRSPDPWAREQEERAFALDRDFVPLLKLGEPFARHGGHVIGYHLAELRKGRTTILGHAGDLPQGTDTALAKLGPSLLDVLHEWLSDHLGSVPPPSADADAPAPLGVDRVAELLRGIETLQQELAILEARTL